MPAFNTVFWPIIGGVVYICTIAGACVFAKKIVALIEKRGEK